MAPPTDTATHERLRRDLFPCEVTLAGELVARGARVFITTTEALIYTAAADGSVELHARIEIGEPPVTFSGPFIGRLEVDTEVGTMHLNRSRGCGCHSPLAALAPPAAW